MKFKYFLRGLGVGIIFASIVCLTAYWGNPAAKMSDEDIIRRAKELGLVEKVDKLDGLLNNTTEEIDKSVVENETATSENTTEDANASTEANTAAEEKSTESVPKESSVTEEKTTNEKTEENTEYNEKTEADEKKETVKITIKKGASSFPVCQMLQEMDMIDDAADFDTYLVENGYASRIRVGEHTLKKGMSYHDIAEAISDPL